MSERGCTTAADDEERRDVDDEEAASERDRVVVVRPAERPPQEVQAEHATEIEDDARVLAGRAAHAFGVQKNASADPSSKPDKRVGVA